MVKQKKAVLGSVSQKTLLWVVFFLSGVSLLKAQSWPDSYSIQKSFTCGLCSVNQPGNAIGNTTSDYATISVPLGVVSSISFDLNFPSSHPAGTILSLWVEDPGGTFDILTGVSYQLMQNASNVANTGWTSINVGSTSQKILYTSGMQPFNKIRITITGLLSVAKVLNVYSVFAGTIPLPVRLTSFKGNTTGSSIELTWVTEYEKESDYFEVQRSGDAKKWTALTRIAARGNSQSAVGYRYTDAQPPTGLTYYRLRQVDLDQTEWYSRIITVSYSGASNPASDQELQVSPNPVQAGQVVALSLSNQMQSWFTSGKMEGTLYDLSGHSWHYKNLEWDSHTGRLQLPAAIPAGIYILRLQTDAFQSSCRIVVR